jgi:hypothetical protein
MWGLDMIRPELAAFARRYSEVLTGLGIAALGLWALQARGGFYQLLAALVLMTGLALAFAGWRKVRFRRAGDAPGIVQILEAQISYFGPDTGGFIGTDDLVELHLLAAGPTWQLVGQDGTRLDIPVAATGSDALYDIFAGLPGVDMPRILAALDKIASEDRALWLHPSRQARWRALN